MNSQTSINNMTDLPAGSLARLITQAQAGKQEALRDIYEAYFARVYRFVFYRVSHRETAEDITEETFIKAFSGLKSLEKAQAFEGWLFQIARNLIIDYYRKKKQLVPLDAVENTLEYETNVVEIINLQIEQSILIKLLKELNDEQQTVIKMKFLEELDNSTIAQILNKTEGAIRVIQHRAISKLKELFDKNIRKG
jgi:RNA polymerase sigma-70 factor (ECF subfamily)